MASVIQAILIVAAMSSLNSGLYSTGRVLRSLGMSKQAPAFTLKMSSQGVPWAGIVMTSVVFVFGAVLNSLNPDAFEIALEAAAIGVVFTWAHDLPLPAPVPPLVNRGVMPASKFQLPGYPWTSYHRSRLPRPRPGRYGISGWQSSPYFWHKTSSSWSSSASRSLAILLVIGWFIVQAQRDRDHTKGPAQGGLVRRRTDLPGLTPESRTVENDPGTNPIDPEAN